MNRRDALKAAIGGLGLPALASGDDPPKDGDVYLMEVTLGIEAGSDGEATMQLGIGDFVKRDEYLERNRA